MGSGPRSWRVRARKPRRRGRGYACAVALHSRRCARFPFDISAKRTRARSRRTPKVRLIAEGAALMAGFEFEGGRLLAAADAKMSLVAGAGFLNIRRSRALLRAA